ncbi:MAG: glycerophosphodiester phosphodiesterase [Infirmifilum sp.]
MRTSVPVIVGHKANRKSILQKYLKLTLKFIEFDVSLANGRLVVKHGVESGAPGVKKFIINYGYLLIEGKDPILAPSNLEEHLKEIAGKAGVWLDVKSRGVETEVVRLALSHGISDVIVSTGFHNMLRKVKESYPSVLTMLGNVDYRPANPIKEVELAHADGVSINVHYIDEELVEELHSVGYKVAVWTVNDPQKAMWLKELNVDYIITDIPEKITKILLGS